MFPEGTIIKCSSNIEYVDVPKLFLLANSYSRVQQANTSC